MTLIIIHHITQAVTKINHLEEIMQHQEGIMDHQQKTMEHQVEIVEEIMEHLEEIINIDIHYYILNSLKMEIKSETKKITETSDEFRPATYLSRVAIILRKLPAITSKAKAAAYASEAGESFRPVLKGNVVKALYGISIGYIFLDVAGRTYCVSNQGREKMSYLCFDTLLWHSLASLYLPMVIIHKLVHIFGFGIKKITKNKIAIAWIPALIALGSVPFIIHPIDIVTDFALDNTVRRLYLDKMAKEDKKLLH
jgi:DNA-binding protein H-NS